MTVRLAAPGKVFLAGEYAVLEGGPALVMGVDRRLHARWEPAARVQLVHLPSGIAWDGGAPPEELRFAVRAAGLALRLCAEEDRPRRGFRLAYEDDFDADGTKLGLGGSAAASVLAVRATLLAQGRSATDAEVLALALAAHWAEQGGEGSGADVAASALGGVLQVRARLPWRSPEEVMQTPARAILRADALAAEPVRVPAEARFLLAFTGKAADTRLLLREVRVFMRGDRGRWAAVSAQIAQASAALRAALESDHREAALDAVRAGAAAMARLGEQARAPVVTAELALACALSSSAGSAAKPSGAGGGDCAVVLAFGDEARDRVEAALRSHFAVFRVAPA